MVANGGHARRWGAYAAFGIALAALVLAGHSYGQYRAGNRASRAVPAKAAPHGVYEPSCEHPQSREDAEFCEERTAAEAEQRSADSAERTIWIGILSLLLIGATLFYTKRAAEAANKAATAAEKALSDFERPWLYLESVGMQRRERTATEWDDDPRPTPYGFWIDITFRNGGRTLAEVVNVEFMFEEKGKLGPNPDYSGNLLALNFERRFIPPEQTGQSGRFGLPIPAFDPDPAYSPPQLVIYGRVKYRGLVSAGHETGFTVEPWFIGGAWISYGGDTYNYHR